MPRTPRQNVLDNASFLGHDWIPQYVVVSDAYWMENREAVEDLCARFPVLFPGFRKGRWQPDPESSRKGGERWADPWGCVWEHEIAGLAGIVVEHPLADWSAWDAWKPPAPPLFAGEARAAFEDRRRRGDLAHFELDHGFFFMRLYYLRGFENFMLDVAAEDPRLERLAGVVLDPDDIIESGVSIVNPQDLVNGIDNIAREVKGRVCVRIDVDRQSVVPFGTPRDVRDLVREEVMKLGSPAGGLEMVVGVYPPTPLANLEARGRIADRE